MRRLLHHLLSVALTLAVGAGFVLLLGGRMSGALDAATSTPPAVFALAVGLALITLVLRTEAWRICLRAAAPDKRPPRDALYCSASCTYLVNLVSHLLAPLVRIGLLLRLAPGQTPKPTQILTADAPALLAEISAVTLVMVLASLLLGFPLLISAGFAALVAALFLLLWQLRRRVRRPFIAGLALLDNRRQAVRVWLSFAAIVALQLLRTALLLQGAGFEGSGAQAVLAFVSAWATGVLPVGGASAGPTGTVAAMGSAEALAGGAMTMLAASLAADLLFLAGAGLVLGLRRIAAAHSGKTT